MKSAAARDAESDGESTATHKAETKADAPPRRRTVGAAHFAPVVMSTADTHEEERRAAQASPGFVTRASYVTPGRAMPGASSPSSPSSPATPGAPSPSGSPVAASPCDCKGSSGCDCASPPVVVDRRILGPGGGQDASDATYEPSDDVPTHAVSLPSPGEFYVAHRNAILAAGAVAGVGVVGLIAYLALRK